MGVQKSNSVRTPIKFAHIVYRTNNYIAMRDFYQNFLNATIAFEQPNAMVFLRYDDEHHRIGIINIPDLQPKVKKSNGLEHVAYTYPSLETLLLAYKERKSFGIKPFWSINHGPTISIYYHDPDGNIVETQWDALDVEEADYFIMSETYKKNPIGSDIDPDAILAQVELGEDLSEFKERKDVGVRTAADVPE